MEAPASCTIRAVTLRLGVACVLVTYVVGCRDVLGIDNPVAVDAGASTDASDGPSVSSGAVHQVVVGSVDTCAVFGDGRAKCWGQGVGALGVRGCFSDFQRGASLPYLDFGADIRVKQIVSGLNHLCALTVDGKVKCWGTNDSGQLGLGDDVTRGCAKMGDALPFVNLGGTVDSLAAGSKHTCALLTDGNVKCWGGNSSGQLGLGHTQDVGKQSQDMGSALPAVSLGQKIVKEIVASEDYTCVRLVSGQAKCWGAGGPYLGAGDSRARGALADDMGDALTPVAPGFEVVSIAPACATDAEGHGKCWGLVWGLGGNPFIGDENGEISKMSFFDFGKEGRITKFARYSNDICAIHEQALRCWGSNANGQLGNGSTVGYGDDKTELLNGIVPVDLGAGRFATDVAVGPSHACAILDNGTLKCWGSNEFGELGLSGGRRGDEPGEMGDALPTVELF